MLSLSWEVRVLFLIADVSGNLHALERNPAALTQSNFPRKLSETGLFKSVKKYIADPGLIPYEVNAALWSDGAFKDRFIALPAGTRIDYTPTRGWNCPDGTVLVKTFSLETRQGDPSSRKRIETRLLTRTVGQWYGYSYLWDDAQDDATLVSAQGLDKDYEISAPSGRQSQRWHYPSRTECMVCHSRAANYVLGLSEPQFNRVHDYNGIKANQLDVLEELGVLRVNWTDDARGKMKASLKRNGANEDDANKAADAAIKSSGRTGPQISPLLTSAPESRTKLVDPYDPYAPLNDRARSYLHANCSVCHVKEGGGNALMEMEFSNSMAKTHLLERPQHDKFGIADPWLVSPGHPEQSVLLHRISTRGQGQMPPLATSVPDAQAIELIRKWISQLKAE